MKTKTLSPKQIAAEIARRNRVFKAANAAQKRVLVAKDVLAQLKAKTIRANSGWWVSTDATVIEGEESLQKQLIAGATCEACALGSVMVSLVRFTNRVTVEEAEDTFGSCPLNFSKVYSGDADDKTGITRIFSKRQIQLIESAFERGEGYFQEDNDIDGFYVTNEVLAATRFGRKYETDHNRLVAIMENIVRNKGTFIP